MSRQAGCRGAICPAPTTARGLLRYNKELRYLTLAARWPPCFHRNLNES